LTHDLRIARVQRTLRWLEEDVPLLAMRVKDLSPERQRLGKAFCREYDRPHPGGLERLNEERAREAVESETPCEPAD